MNIKIIAVCTLLLLAIATNFLHLSSSADGGLQEQTPIILTFDDLLNAIEFVESGGNNQAIGDNGKAIGAFQIWKIYVDDCNRIIGNNKYSYSDRLSPSKSRQMVKVYIGHYATEKRLKRPPTFEDMAAMHCAGPNGYLQKEEPAVKKYLEKIEKELAK